MTLKNGQYRDTGINGHTRQRQAKQNTTQKTQKMSNTDPIKKPGVNPGDHKEWAVPASC